MDNWREVTIEDIASRIAMGPFGSDIKTDNFVEVGVPVIRGNNLKSGRFRAEGFAFLTDEKADELANANAFPGDLVITHRGTLGQVGLVPVGPFRRYVVSQSQMKVTCDPDKADALFVYYFFKSPAGQHRLLMNTAQTGVPAISRPVTSLKGVRLELPSLQEQRAIAQILGALDDKIDLNRRTNETLEAIARAIFKSWFVDFDPVRAKMEDRQALEISAEIAGLFPEFMEESEAGLLPTGWRKSSVHEEFVVLMGQSPPGNTYNERGEGVPMYQGKAEFGARFPTRRLFCTAPKRMAKPGDTLVSVRAPVGAMNMAAEDCCIGRGLASVRHKSGSRSYTYYAMHALAGQFQSFEAEGTVFGSINKEAFASLGCIAPPLEVTTAFERIIAPIDSKIELLESESRVLGELRDTILPKLISGEIRLSDAASLAEAAT